MALRYRRFREISRILPRIHSVSFGLSTTSKVSHERTGELDLLSFIKSTLNVLEGPCHCWLNRSKGGKGSFKNDGTFLVHAGQFLETSLTTSCDATIMLEKVSSAPHYGLCVCWFDSLKEYITFPIILSNKNFTEGRCSATQANVLLLFLFLTVVSAQKTTFTVGDKSGWTFNVKNWTDGKTFKAGDELVFNYDPSLHNVAVVDANEYSSCSASSSSKTFTTGKDLVKLSKGLNYFICTVPGHCDAGVKISVNAT